MLNALLPGTAVPIHRHEATAETVVCLCGKLDEVIYEALPSVSGVAEYREVQRIRLAPTEGTYGCQIPKGAWHTVEVDIRGKRRRIHASLIGECGVVFVSGDTLCGVSPEFLCKCLNFYHIFARHPKIARRKIAMIAQKVYICNIL